MLQDGAGYEVWLITETSGQQVERPIVKFEVTGGRPGPATEELPDTFEPYELKPLEFQQPDENGEPLPEPMGETSAIVKPLEVSSVVAVGKISDREYAEASVDVDGTAESAQNQIAADSSQAGAEQPDNGVRQDVSSISSAGEAEAGKAEPGIAAALLAPAIGLTTAARWKRRQVESEQGLSRSARAVRRMQQNLQATTGHDHNQ